MNREYDRRELCEFLVETFRPAVSCREAARQLGMDRGTVKRITETAIQKIAEGMLREGSDDAGGPLH